MGCCFCCLSEGDKVSRVLDKFPPVAASQAQDGLLQKVVGRVVLAGTSPILHRVVVNHASGIVRMFTKRGERSRGVRIRMVTGMKTLSTAGNI